MITKTIDNNLEDSIKNDNNLEDSIKKQRLNLKENIKLAVGENLAKMLLLGKKYKKTIISMILASVILAGPPLYNKYTKSRKFEDKLKSSNNNDIMIGDINLDSILKENKLEIDASLLNRIYMNEENYKTKDRIGDYITNYSEGINKIRPAMRTPNKSFGTRQIQGKAFLSFIREMDNEAKIEFIKKLCFFKINGVEIWEKVGYERSGTFIDNIEKGDYYTSDGDGSLGFAMSILMIENIYNNISVRNNNIDSLHKDNPASKELLSKQYKQGLVGAFWATDYIRAKEDAPKQVEQNINIIMAYLDGKIKFEEIKRVLNSNSTDNNSYKLTIDLPDGDIGNKYKHNQSYLDSLYEENIDSIDKKLQKIQDKISKLTINEKKELAILFSNVSFETMYFNFNKIKNVNIHNDIVANKKEIESIENIINTFDDNTLNIFLSNSINILIIITDPKIYIAMPFIQKESGWASNEVNTAGRFIDTYYNNTNSTKDTINSTKDTINSTKDTINSTKDTINSTKNTINSTKDTIKANLTPDYKVIAQKKLTKGQAARTLLLKKRKTKATQTSIEDAVLKYMINNKYKTVENDLITANTPINLIPEKTVASFLSYNKKNPKPLTEADLKRIPANTNIYIIIPKTNNPAP